MLHELVAKLSCEIMNQPGMPDLATIFDAHVDSSDAAVLIADLALTDCPVVWVSRQFEIMTGYPRAEVIGRNCRYLQGNDRLQPEIGQIGQAMRIGEPIKVTLRNYRKNGQQFWNELCLVPLTNTVDIVTHYMGVMRDVTETVTNRRDLAHSSSCDRLTALPNRYSFLDELDRLGCSDGQLMVAKLDIRGMHAINSTLGYVQGDELIRQSAQRLSRLGFMSVSRTDGNEFAMAMPLSEEMSEAEVLELIAGAMGRSFVIGEDVIHSHYGLGYAVGPNDGNGSLLAQQAAEALHRAKAEYSLAVFKYDPDFARNASVRRRLVDEIRGAVAKGQFGYHYQPKVSLATRKVVGAEALMRWHHPLFGLQGPDFFIPVAEASGLILPIETGALLQAATFIQDINCGRPVPLNFSINLSPVQFSHGDIVATIGDVIERTKIDPAWLTLELTESLLIDDGDAALNAFREIRARGLGISIDDFGIGYSSLSRVEAFPITQIKIDRSFVSGITGTGVRRIVAETTISLAAALGVEVVAEGIETEEQLLALQELGCTVGQGYLFRRPLEPERFTELVGPDGPACI